MSTQGERTRRQIRRARGAWKPWSIYDWFGIDRPRDIFGSGLWKRRRGSRGWFKWLRDGIKTIFSPAYRKQKRERAFEERVKSELHRMKKSNLNRQSQLALTRRTQHKG